MGLPILQGADLSQGPPRILICDDEPHISAVIAQRLEDSGYLVQEARDGQEGLMIAGTQAPVLIITDLQMPRMSGLEMAIALKATPGTGEIPVIMVTGRGHIVSENDLARTCIRTVLPKPFSARQLLGIVNDVLREGRESSSRAA
jgi:CheY-like chemotaxis protein